MVLRVLDVILLGFVCAAIGLILGSIIGGNLAAVNYHLVFNGREGYEAGGQIGFILGALIGLIGSGVRLFGRRAEK